MTEASCTWSTDGPRGDREDDKKIAAEAADSSSCAVEQKAWCTVFTGGSVYSSREFGSSAQ